jgi:hypothetical protein
MRYDGILPNGLEHDADLAEVIFTVNELIAVCAGTLAGLEAVTLAGLGKILDEQVAPS